MHDIIVKVGKIISSFFFKSKVVTAISSAAVPLDTATACYLPNFFAIDFSSSTT